MPFDPCPISTVLDSTVRLPSPSMRTPAADVDGVTVLFSATANPRPTALRGGASRFGVPQPIHLAVLLTISSKCTSCRCSLVANVSPSCSTLRSRISTGSSPSARAMSSIWHSPAQCACGAPYPRNAPAGGRFVYAAYESTFTWGMRYGPGLAYPPFLINRGLMSAYAPALQYARTSRAVIVPSRFTPVRM